MKRILSLLFVTSLLSSCMVGVSGNGHVDEETRKVENFDGIDVGGMFEIHLVQSANYDVKVVADENLMELIETYVEGGVLKISSRENIRKAKELDIYISAPNYNSLDLSGAVTVDNKGSIRSTDLSINSSGASEINMNIDTQKLNLDLSGASEVRLSGIAEYVNISASGASDMEMFELKTKEMKLSLSGASEVDCNVSEDLQIDASGASEINYIGSATISRKDLSGASSINNKN